MTGKFRTAVTIFFLLPIFTLGACGTIQNISGKSKNSPDEFAVVTQPPLIMPPDWTITPPAPGEAVPQRLASSVETLRALFPDDPDVIPQASLGEAALLRSIEARPLADVRSDLHGETDITEKGTLLEDINSIDERTGSPDGTSIEHVSSEPEGGK